jgi:N-acetylglucosaminylphosphatidylinositol deacetylase
MHTPPSTPSGRAPTTLLHVVVTAHPDDESMFFVPCIRNLVLSSSRRRRQQQSASAAAAPPVTAVWLLCLTTGNYNGLGAKRSAEVHAAARDVLHMDRVLVLDDGDGSSMQDHPHRAWKIERAADAIHRTLQTAILNDELFNNNVNGVDAVNLITFDRDGVSGHVNHRDTYLAVRYLLLQQQQQQHALPRNKRLARKVTAWSLQTVHNPCTKYFPMSEWLRLILAWMGLIAPMMTSSSSTSSLQRSKKNMHNHHRSHHRDDDDEDDTAVVYCYRLLEPSLNWKAMSAHASQFVWYRRLFVVFSCYTYVNKLVRIDDDEFRVAFGKAD